MTQINKHA